MIFVILYHLGVHTLATTLSVIRKFRAWKNKAKYNAAKKLQAIEKIHREADKVRIQEI